MKGSGVDVINDEMDFSTWSMGNGKMRDKKQKLESLLTQLMDKTNKKLKKEHDKYCSKCPFL